MSPNRSVLVFDGAYLAGDIAAGDVERTVSQPVPVDGNHVVIEATLINASGLDDITKLVLVLEGTFDDKVWFCPEGSPTVEFTKDEPGAIASSAYTGVSYSAVRLRATINGEATEALFNASLAFSPQ